MGIFDNAKGLVDSVGKTTTDLIRGRAREESNTIEIGERPEHMKASPGSKILVNLMMVAMFLIGVFILFRKPLMMSTYLELLRVFGGTIFVPIVIAVLLGTSFKRSKWSKEL